MLHKYARIAPAVAGLATSFMYASSAFAQSAIVDTTAGTPVTPSVVDVYLEPDDAVTFRVEVDITSPSALDVFLLNDLSGSFSDDLSNVRSSMPSLVSGLSGIASDVNFGLGSFVDKPMSPFGGSSAYVYKTHLALTDDTAALQTAVNGMTASGGSDSPESQLEALFQVALRSAELGFRSDAFKTVVLQTDAVYHKAGDGTPYGLVANDGDADIEAGEDYPFVSQVRDALLSAGIAPVFAVTSNVRASYEGLVEELGFGQVVTLNSDSSNITSAVQSGITEALSDVKLFAESDDYDYVREIASDVSGEKAGTDMDVPSGERAKFDVTLSDRSADGAGEDDTLYLTATGYGRTTVNVTVPKPTPAPESTPEPGTLLGLMSVGFMLKRAVRRQEQDS